MIDNGKQDPISIIVVSYKNTFYLTNCLNSILTNTDYPNYEVIDVHYGELKNFVYPSNKVKVVNVENNPGYSEANSIRVSYSKGRFPCLLNNDTVVSKSGLSSLYSLLISSDKIGCMQSKLRLLDYLSVGFPVVANNIGGWTKIVEDEKIGVLTNDHPKSFSQEIIKLIDNQVDSQEFSEKSFRLITTKLSWDSSANLLLEEYEALLS